MEDVELGGNAQIVARQHCAQSLQTQPLERLLRCRLCKGKTGPVSQGCFCAGGSRNGPVCRRSHLCLCPGSYSLSEDQFRGLQLMSWHALGFKIAGCLP